MSITLFDKEDAMFLSAVSIIATGEIPLKLHSNNYAAQ